MIRIIKIICLAAFIFIISGFRKNSESLDLIRAKTTFDCILKYYSTGSSNLFNEYFPLRPDDRVTYLAGNDTVIGQRAAFLWPTSGVLSAAIALLSTTGDKKYLKIIDKKLLQGLELYYDNDRNPPCYQSYLKERGISDRYYDDNIWLAIDFCNLYNLTGKKIYLEKSRELWNFVLSGIDDRLGGGIYWCEQKKQTKNTCSNAPASVLAFKLFRATSDSSYFNYGLRIYNWTRTILQDSTDHLYFDNIRLDGRIDRRKFTYNSGQMLQASAMLYSITSDTSYLKEAQAIAESVIACFTEDFVTPGGKIIRLFRNTGNWFNAVLLRGYEELYRIDGNETYIKIFHDNMDHLWDNVRDGKGLFSKEWKGGKEESHKWLLDQAGLVEIWAVLARSGDPL